MLQVLEIFLDAYINCEKSENRNIELFKNTSAKFDFLSQNFSFILSFVQTPKEKQEILLESPQNILFFPRDMANIFFR